MTTSGERVRDHTNETPTTVRVTVRYFGAARAAAATEAELLTVESGTSIADLACELGDRNPRLAAVLTRCSYLCDGVAVRDAAAFVRTGQTIDVLPPFAGG
jgi:molybdopterin converting factor small subunit